ncbi:MAG: DUF6454 family protein [Pirellulales bacterium]
MHYAPPLAALFLLLPHLILVVQAEESFQPKYIRQAHAHNDYYHQRPLLDALERGFCSVEADVYLANGKLFVGHSKDELNSDRTLASLYLDPLKKIIQKNNGRVHPNYPWFTLLVDVKSEPILTYQALHQLLSNYRDILTMIQNNKATHGAVRVILGGNRAWKEIEKTKIRFCGIDGRLADLGSEKSAHLLPLISDNWKHHFNWRGEGDFPEDEKQKLHSIVHQAHLSERAIRFWNTPEKQAVWKVLNNAGVDFINTDNLSGLNAFFAGANTRNNHFYPQYDSHIPLPEVTIGNHTTSVHTQGLYLTPKYYYVTGRLNESPRRALLFRFLRTDTSQYEYVDITPGEDMTRRNNGVLDHPGGMDSDGQHLWIPISSSQRKSLSVVVKLPINDMQPLTHAKHETVFEVNDHIGAIAWDAQKNQLYGANWDTLISYCWTLNGGLIEKIPRNKLIQGDPDQKMAVQDWKSYGKGILIMGGQNRREDRSPLSSYAILEIVDMSKHQRLGQGRIFSPTLYEGTITHEGFSVEGDYLYFLPHDLGTKANIYRYRWNNPVK